MATPAKATVINAQGVKKVVNVGDPIPVGFALMGADGKPVGAFKTAPAPTPTSPTAPKQATLYGPPGTAPKIVTVGSGEASQLQSQGWGLTPGSYKAPGGTTSTSGSSTPSSGTTQTNTSSGATTPPPSTASQVPTGTQVSRDPNGRYNLVIMTTDPTPGDPNTGTENYWLFDSTTKNYHPFASVEDTQAFLSANGMDPNKISTYATRINPTSMSQDMVGKFLPMNYAVSADGTVPNYSTTSNTYGGTVNVEDTKNAIASVGSFFKKMVQTGNIPTTTWDLLSNPDGKYVAKFAQAGMYGGYNLGDMWRQAMIDHLAKTDPRYANMKAIDPDMSADQFYKTQAFADLLRDPNVGQIPVAVYKEAVKSGDMSMGEQLLKTPLYRIDKKFFQELVPTIDWNDPNMRAEAEKIQAAYYDLLQMQTQASTQQEKQIADAKFEEFKNALAKNYGIQLSLNAEQAWKQLNALTESFTNRGLGNTGLLDEAHDKTLQSTRKSDEAVREQNAKNFNSEELRHLREEGSPQEIQDYIAKNGLEAAQKAGLVPSQETKDFYSTANLKKNFPTWTDEQIKDLQNTMVDENGNYRSTLYKNQFKDLLAQDQEKFTKQQAILEAQKKNDYDKAMEPFDKTMWGDQQGLSDAPVKAALNTPEVTSGPGDLPAEETPTGTPKNPTDTSKQATLYGPAGQYEVVDVGSARASQLQSQGWGLTAGSYKAPAASTPTSGTTAPKLATLYGPPGTAPKVVTVGSGEAAQLQSQGWGLTAGSYKAPTSTTPAAGTTAPKLATLYGPTGTAPKVVTVGSSEASQLQSQGWGLTAGSYKAPAPAPAPLVPRSLTSPSPVKIQPISPTPTPLAPTPAPAPTPLTNTSGQTVSSSSLPAGWTLGPDGRLRKL